MDRTDPAVALAELERVAWAVYRDGTSRPGNSHAALVEPLYGALARRGVPSTRVPLAGVPRDLLRRALVKARLLYVEAARAAGQDPGRDDECWAEFEALADYIEVERDNRTGQIAADGG